MRAYDAAHTDRELAIFRAHCKGRRLCAAVEVNESRGFKFKPHHNDSSDNFTTNLAFVLLRLAEAP